MLRSVVFVLIVLFQFPAVASKITGSLDRPVLHLYDESLFCTGQFIRVQEELVKVTEDSPYFLAAQLQLQYFPESRNGNIKELDRLHSIRKSLTDHQRVVIAAGLLNAAHTPVDVVRDFLDSPMEDKVLDTYRKTYLLALKSDSHLFDRIKQSVELFSVAPYLDIYVLINIYIEGLQTLEPVRFLTQYQPFIAKFPEGPSLNLLKALDLRLKTDPESVARSRELLKSAYEACPYDVTIALEYGLSLPIAAEAEVVFRRITELPSVSAYDYYILGIAQYPQGKYLEALSNWNKADSRKEYLSKDLQKDLRESIDGFYLGFAGLFASIVVLIIALVFVLKARKKKYSEWYF